MEIEGLPDDAFIVSSIPALAERVMTEAELVEADVVNITRGALVDAQVQGGDLQVRFCALSAEDLSEFSTALGVTG